MKRSLSLTIAVLFLLGTLALAASAAPIELPDLVFCEHTSTESSRHDEDQHKYVCQNPNCAKEVLENHTWDDGEVTLEPTATEDGQIMRFSSLGARIKPYIPGPVGSLGIFSLCLVGTRTPLWYSSPNSNCFGLPGLLVLTPQLRKSA